MTVTPNDTFLEFEKHFSGLPERCLLDELSESDIKIFYTPEGQLCSEQGVYIAETVATKNTKLARGRFRAYDDQDEIIEKILLASKKTALHDDVLRIISMHLDPILPLPRPRMLSALYHALGVVPAYQVLIAPMLNELCLGLQSDELASSILQRLFLPSLFQLARWIDVRESRDRFLPVLFFW